MATKTQGTAHVYGVNGTVTDATVQSFNLKRDYQNRSNTLNETGNEVERRMDDEIKEGSIVIRIQAGYTEPDVGDVITYDGVNYEITNIDRGETNNAHVQLTLNIKTTEYVTLTP